MCFKCRTLYLWEKEYWSLSAFHGLQDIPIAHLNAHSFSQFFFYQLVTIFQVYIVKKYLTQLKNIHTHTHNTLPCNRIL
jgi:hypothetical protein